MFKNLGAEALGPAPTASSLNWAARCGTGALGSVGVGKFTASACIPQLTDSACNILIAK